MRPMNATNERATARPPGWMRAVAVHHQISLLAQAPTLRPLPAQAQVPPLLPRPRVDDPPRTQTPMYRMLGLAAYGGRKAVAERMRVHTLGDCLSRLSGQRFEYCGALRAFFKPYFLRSIARGSRVRKPAFFSAGRSSGCTRINRP